MKKNNTANKLLGQKIKDYSYITVFFLMFSFFVFFAIRPNLETVFSLKKELKGLQQLNKEYDQEIVAILRSQAGLEQYRNDLPMLVQALPETPHIDVMVQDLQKSASDSGIILDKVDIEEIKLKDPKAGTNTKRYTVSLSTTANFDKLQGFINAFLNQRRIKTVNKVDIARQNKEASGDATLRVSLDLEGYYL